MKYMTFILILTALYSCALINLKMENRITTIPSIDYEIMEEGMSIAISFSEDVDQTSVEAITNIRRNGSKIEVNFDWKDGKNVILNSIDPLYRGLEYRLEIQGIYRNMSGDEREADRSVPFYSQSSVFSPLQVLNSCPADGSIHTGGNPVSITFNKDVDTSTLNESLTVSPSLNISKKWSDEKINTLIIQADDGWDNLTKYKISLNEALSSREGDPLYPDWDLSFYIEDGITTPYVDLCGSCSRDSLSGFPWIAPDLETLSAPQAIRIRFSEVMDQKKTESSFNLTPSLAGDFYWRENDLIFCPVQSFSSSQDFRLEIEKEAENSNGIAMARNFIVDFQPAIEELKLLSLECSSPGGFILDSFSSVESAKLPVQAVTPFDLTFHLTFSEPFSTDYEKQRVQDSLSFYEIFSSGGSPDIGLFSWSTDYILTVIVSGFPAGSDSDYYYLMELEGGSQGICNSEGSTLTESVIQLFKVARQ